MAKRKEQDQTLSWQSYVAMSHEPQAFAVCVAESTDRERGLNISPSKAVQMDGFEFLKVFVVD